VIAGFTVMCNASLTLFVCIATARVKTESRYTGLHLHFLLECGKVCRLATAYLVYPNDGFPSLNKSCGGK
jgi:hypothetical protein